MKKSLFLCLILICHLSLTAQLEFNYNNDIASIYQDIYELKLDKASSALDEYQSKEPSNLAALHMRSYVDFFSLFINEDQDLYDHLISNKSVYLSQLKKGNQSSPYYRFARAEVLLQWALIDLKFDNKFKAGKAIYNAYKLLEKNKELHPDFIDNNKSLSIIHVLAESLPEWVRSILGINGSIQLGEAEIQSIKDYAYNNNNYIFRLEVAAINSYILFYQSNKKEQAIEDLNSFGLDHKTSPIVAFLKASMALRSGDNDGCITYLTESPKGSEYAKFYYLDFMMGRSLLYKMEAEADQHLLEYTRNFKGKHFIKEAYQKLAWHALVIKQDEDLHKSYLKQVLTEGEALLDEDKQALKEAKKSNQANPILLRARIYYDGGYLHQAYQLLTLNSTSFDSSSSHCTEYNYRLGRILQGLHNPIDALFHFAKVVDSDKENTTYYPCASLLQMGKIYENRGVTNQAKRYYQWCLDTNTPEYKTTLHQKAKSGLDRVINQ